MNEQEPVPQLGGDGGKPKGKAKVLVFTLVLVAAVGGGAFVLGGRVGGAPAEAAEPAPAATPPPAATVLDAPVVLMEPITMSLSDGHYLKVGIALQLAPPSDDEAAEDSDGPAMSPEQTAHALDETIRLFGARTMSNLGSPEQRKVAKDELTKVLAEAYGGRVTDVYFTDFAMQ